MRHGVETEWGAWQSHDARHAKRLAPWLARLRENPGPRLPSACHGRAETVAASRCLDTPASGEQAMLSGHRHATRERGRAPEVVLLVPETTLLNYGTTRQKPGMGAVQVKSREEDLRQPRVALTPERVN